MADSSKRAVIYARFSSSKQREASIEDQLRVCTEWCVENDYEIVAEYCDRAASGRSDARPEFQRMISNAGESDIVLVYMMDRFSRDVYDAPIYKKKLRDAGVRVVSATESMPDGPESILIESIYEAMAAMESQHTSVRTRRGMEGNALKCMHNGVSVFGYDFGDDGHYVVNEAEAEVVREVFARRIGGESMNLIATDLAARGYVTGHGNPANHNMVKSMLANEKYVGTYVWGDVRVDGGMPAIIDRETFDMAQMAVSRKRRKEEDWGDYAFAGKGVCMECGMNLVGVSGRGHGNVKYSYYRCGHKCGCRPVRADWLEASVAEEIRNMLADRESALEVARCVADMAQREGEASERQKDAQRRLSQAKSGIANVLKAVEAGMDYEDVRDRLAELKLQRARVEADLRTAERIAKVDVDSFADMLQSGTGLTDRELLDAFVWQVVLGSERVYVVLNYDTEECEPAWMEFLIGSHDSSLVAQTTSLFESTRAAELVFVHGHAVIGFRRAA